ncbi:HAMP domain-containing sensor histidine kinase [Cohnella rhizosphaerae]|uniref:histidine kinase n=1 Tax=Cohnella rhizosphaerae TaxID=1457232 RepID=A0A9X4QSD7_9BACL|nr:HAMP domain-containing sensor histidine kinase [Cohnella rhizosphaerae]MDG0809981.1 HAMP domain-containing histidine kinase [Cohnella rhizosphaerae]
MYRTTLPSPPPLSFALFAAGFLGVFYGLTNGSIRYLVRLEDSLNAMAGGDLDHRLTAERADELGRVAAHINAMAEQLETRIRTERQNEQAKLELITGISHDLRTPLTSMLGYLELLRGRAYRDERERERFLVNTHSKAIQLKSRIDDLFDYTRLSASEARLHPERIDLRELVRQLLAEFEPLAAEQGLSVAASLPAGGLELTLDPGLASRAIDNLLTNALKYADKPGVVRLRLAAADGRAVLEIANRGAPIGPEQEARLFERFYKADAARSPAPSAGGPAGAGLGLSIAREIARLHGGRLGLTYRDGDYRFALELPMD